MSVTSGDLNRTSQRVKSSSRARKDHSTEPVLPELIVRAGYILSTEGDSRKGIKAVELQPGALRAARETRYWRRRVCPIRVSNPSLCEFVKALITGTAQSRGQLLCSRISSLYRVSHMYVMLYGTYGSSITLAANRSKWT